MAVVVLLSEAGLKSRESFLAAGPLTTATTRYASDDRIQRWETARRRSSRARLIRRVRGSPAADLSNASRRGWWESSPTLAGGCSDRRRRAFLQCRQENQAGTRGRYRRQVKG